MQPTTSAVAIQALTLTRGVPACLTAMPMKAHTSTSRYAISYRATLGAASFEGTGDLCVSTLAPLIETQKREAHRDSVNRLYSSTVNSMSRMIFRSSGLTIAWLP